LSDFNTNSSKFASVISNAILYIFLIIMSILYHKSNHFIYFLVFKKLLFLISLSIDFMLGNKEFIYNLK
jgi:hypothetical protein